MDADSGQIGGKIKPKVLRKRKWGKFDLGKLDFGETTGVNSRPGPRFTPRRRKKAFQFLENELGFSADRLHLWKGTEFRVRDWLYILYRKMFPKNGHCDRSASIIAARV